MNTKEEDDFFRVFEQTESLNKETLKKELNQNLPQSLPHCPKCQKRNVTEVDIQMKRWDEPGSHQYTCDDCEHRWCKK